MMVSVTEGKSEWREAAGWTNFDYNILLFQILQKYMSM
jgi:hypothetical protein